MTNTAACKAREFWIEIMEYNDAEQVPDGFDAIVHKTPFRNTLHVIEKSAYEALERERDALIEELVSTKTHLMKERDELKATVESLTNPSDGRCMEIEGLRSLRYKQDKKIQELHKQNAELREALRLYADKKNWDAREASLGNGISIKIPAFGFGPSIAIEALAKAEGRNGG